MRKRRPQWLRAGNYLEGYRPAGFASQFPRPLPVFGFSPKFVAASRADNMFVAATLTKQLLLENDQKNPAVFSKWHHLLWCEEVQCIFDMALYNVVVENPLAQSGGRLLEVPVPGLAEKRPSVLRGDSVFIKQGKTMHRTFVHFVNLDSVVVSAHSQFVNNPPFLVEFHFSRTPFRAMHRAVEALKHKATPSEVAKPTTSTALDSSLALNDSQLSACRGAVNNREFVIWGPPGTGKTTCLVATIVGLLRGGQDAKILVCAPTNFAADLICEKLIDQGVTPKEMFRLNATMRMKNTVPDRVLEYSAFANGSFQLLEYNEILAYRVIVATCSASSYVHSKIPTDKSCELFTHVFIDEAAQTLEPESAIPIACAKPSACVVLAGDHKQLGPIVRSSVAKEFGLGVSMMERRICATEGAVPHQLLRETYRSHPSIMRLYSEAFYDNALVHRPRPAQQSLVRWAAFLHNEASLESHPVIFHHINGREARDKDSPSWYNQQEIEVVKSYVESLLSQTDLGVTLDDIGIITPYYKQVQKLKAWVHNSGLNGITVGTVEAFQGKEKRVVIVSCVRSSVESVALDKKFALGFASSPNRLNVAISRAVAGLVVVGNMDLFAKDPDWWRVLNIANQLNAFRPLPYTLPRKPGQMAAKPVAGTDENAELQQDVGWNHFE